MSRRIQIVYNKCRCGKMMAGLSKSLTGAEAARKKFAGLCGDCATKEEKEEILNEQAKALRNKIS